jgi:hypothetical protein
VNTIVPWAALTLTKQWLLFCCYGSRDFASREKNQWPLDGYRRMCFAARLRVSNCPDIISTSELGIIWERRLRAHDAGTTGEHHIAPIVLRIIAYPSSEQTFLAIGFYLSLLMARFWDVPNYNCMCCGFLWYLCAVLLSDSMLDCLLVAVRLQKDSALRTSL